MGNINSYVTDTEVIPTYQISSEQECYDTNPLTMQSESDSITSPPSSVPLEQNSNIESQYNDPLIVASESNINNNYNMEQNYELLSFVYAQCNEYDADNDDDAANINLMPPYQPIGYHTIPPISITTSVISNPPQQDSDNETEYIELGLSVPSEWETDDEAIPSIPTPITDPLSSQQNSDNDNDEFGDQDVESNDIYQQDANNNLMLSQQHNDMHQDDGHFEYPPWDEYDDDDIDDL